MSILEKIEVHKQQALSKRVPEDLKTCPHCHESPFFKAHDLRSRKFLAIIDLIVYRIDSFLGRWKCPACGKSFTYYPDFALPFKRYVKESVVKLAEEYLENEQTSYQQTVDPIAYDREPDENEPCLEKPTLWRWVGWLGSLEENLSNALHLIRQKSPSHGIFRQMNLVSPRKYRSDKRKEILNLAVRFLRTEREFKEIFKISIFPRFATGVP